LTKTTAEKKERTTTKQFVIQTTTLEKKEAK
jgi:hypothetical protein